MADAATRKADLERLKKNKRENQEERARLKARMEEDKRERAERFNQQQVARETVAQAQAAARAEHSDASTSVLALRTEDGALRHTCHRQLNTASARQLEHESIRLCDSAHLP